MEIFEKEITMTNETFEKAKKRLKGWGYTIIIFALLSLTAFEDAGGGLIAFSILGVGFCVIAGIWLIAKPSTVSGTTALISLVILTVMDGILSGYASAPLFFVFLDLFVATVVFVNLVQLKNASGTPSKTSVLSIEGQPVEVIPKAIDKNKAAIIVRLKDPGFLAGIQAIEFIVDGKPKGLLQFGETKEFEIDPGKHAAKIILHGIIRRSSKQLEFSVDKGKIINIEGKYSRVWGKINIETV